MRVLLSRYLGASSLGIYQVALSFLGVFSTVVSSGIPVTISHVSAKCGVNNNYKKEGAYISAGLIIGTILSLLMCISIILFKNLIIKSTNEISYNILFIVMPSLFATAIYSCFRGALWGREKHTANCLAELGEQGIRLILFLILLTNASNQTNASYMAGLSLCISCFISMLISIIFFKKYGGKLYSPKNEYKSLLKTSSTITITRIITSLVQPIVAVILPMRLIDCGYSGNLAMSLFGIALGMTFPLLALPNTICGSFAVALVPEMSSILEKKENNSLKEKINLSISITLLSCFCFMPMFLGLGKELGELLFDNTMSGYLLSISAWTMIPSGLCLITNSILNTLDMEKQGFLTYIAGTIFLFLSIWFLPKYCGVSSVIYGIGVSNLITATLNFALISKKTKIKNSILKPLGLMTLFSLPCAMLGKYLHGIFKYIFPSLISIGLSAFICTACFIVLCMIFNLIDLKYLLKDVKFVKTLKLKIKKQNND